ncbi:MAG: hypothetical protein K2Q09_02000 [Phycisphaerales bacterium]|nr:hypothetical protein [Phycisphaerales bacterium]
MEADRLTPRTLAQLREWRGARGRERDLTLTVPLAQMAKELKAKMACAGVGAAFLKTAPRQVAAFTTLVGVRSGVLQLRPHNTATRYALDRWLRSGGEAALVRACPSAISRVRLV